MTSLPAFALDLWALLPEVFLAGALGVLLSYGVAYSTSTARAFPLLGRPTLGLALWSLLLTAGLVAHGPITQALLCAQAFQVDAATTWAKLLLLGATGGAGLLSGRDLARQRLAAFEYGPLVLLAVLGMLCMVSSADLLTLYLSLELQGLCLYVLAALQRTSPFAAEAGLKYFLLGAFSSGVFLLGCSLLYGTTGTTQWHAFATLGFGGGQTEVSPALLLGVLCLFVGLLFKLAAAPFHVWAPDVYEGAPTPVTCFFAVAPKVALLAALMRLALQSFYEFALPWQQGLLLCSLLSLLVGALGAMAQSHLKRLLAYSSIGHVGYMLLALACGTLEGAQALHLYLAFYLCTALCSFGVLLALQGVGGGRPRMLSDLAQLGVANPALAFTLAVALFSMAGIPPLAGFLGKWAVFGAALGAQYYGLAVVGVLTSVVSCFYYLRLVQVLYFEPTTRWVSYHRPPWSAALVLGLALGALLGAVLYPSPIFMGAHRAALALCA
uniref:NADH dehydrogenase subunit 2 n=1 Tax=Picocystis salinarum TaxID=88271 RepID=A0A4D6C4A8_9CHLO|nr:NADH dehydrogenase subunit 2 [Picocystis salinarum]QBX98525.1 NADH dehydrogenase subunit 2 [Picocystis salinarum]